VVGEAGLLFFCFFFFFLFTEDFRVLLLPDLQKTIPPFMQLEKKKGVPLHLLIEEQLSRSGFLFFFSPLEV